MLAYRKLSTDLFYGGHPELSQFIRDAGVGVASLIHWYPPSFDDNYYGWPAGFAMYDLSYSYMVYYPRWISEKVVFNGINVFYSGQPISHYPRFIQASDKTYGSCADKTQTTFRTLTCATSIRIDDPIGGYYTYMYNTEIYLFGPQTGTETNTFYKYYTYYTGYTYSHVYSWTTYYNYTIPAVYYGKYTYTTQYTYTTLYNYLYTGTYYTNLYA